MNPSIKKKIGRHLYVQLAKIMGFPSFVHIELTNKCNLRCEMCEYNKITNKGNKLSFEKFKKIFDEVIKSNPLSKIYPKLLLFDLTGIGENLLHEEFFKILGYMKAKKVTITFATNATLLNKKNSKRLIDLGLDILFISIDGATKKTYEGIRKGAKFEKVMENIKQFNNLKNKMNKNKPEVIIRFLASKHNLEEMPQMIDIADSIGVKNISMTNMNTSKEFNHLRADIKRFNELKKEVLKKAAEKNIRVDFGFTKKRPINECKRPFNSMYVTSEGYVLPCCFINQGGRYQEIINNHNLGNVLKENIKDIWKSKKYKQLHKTIKQGESPEVCKDCYLYYPLK